MLNITELVEFHHLNHFTDERFLNSNKNYSVIHNFLREVKLFSLEKGLIGKKRDVQNL